MTFYHKPQPKEAGFFGMTRKCLK